MTGLNITPPQVVSAPPQVHQPSNGVSFKWIAGLLISVGIAIAGLVVANTEPQSVVSLRERVAVLETVSKTVDKKLDELKADIQKLDQRSEQRSDEILRRLERERRRP